MRTSAVFNAVLASDARRRLGPYTLCALAAIFLVAIYLSFEHPAYAWDYSFYWHKFQTFGGLFESDFSRFLSSVQESVAFDDYNLSGIVALMPIYSLFGGSRLTYVASISAIYLVPSIFVAYRLAGSDVGTQEQKKVALAATLLFPVFWNAALRGMIDVVGLIPLGLACITVWDTRFLTVASWNSAFRLGIMLWLALLLRRWYAFSLVSLTTLSFLAALVQVTRVRCSQADLVRVMELWAITAVASFVGLIFFQWPLVNKILATPYSEIYSAYQAPFWRQVEIYYREFDAFTLILVALGVTFDLVHRRRKSAFFLTAALTTAWLFSKVQAPGVHHFLPIALMLMPAYCSGVVFAYDSLPSLCRPLVFTLLTFNFANDFLPRELQAFVPFSQIFQESRYPPLRLENYSEYTRLVSDLEMLEPGARVAVFASSFNLSDSLLVALNEKLKKRIIGAAQVDLRDHFSWETLTADYFVISHPEQLHLPPAGQRVISFPAQEIVDHYGIGLSMEPTGRTYRLGGGVVAEIYRRVRKIPPQISTAWPSVSTPSTPNGGRLIDTMLA